MGSPSSLSPAVLMNARDRLLDHPVQSSHMLPTCQRGLYRENHSIHVLLLAGIPEYLLVCLKLCSVFCICIHYGNSSIDKAISRKYRCGTRYNANFETDRYARLFSSWPSSSRCNENIKFLGHHLLDT